MRVCVCVLVKKSRRVFNSIFIVWMFSDLLPTLSFSVSIRFLEDQLAGRQQAEQRPQIHTALSLLIFGGERRLVVFAARLFWSRLIPDAPTAVVCGSCVLLLYSSFGRRGPSPGLAMAVDPRRPCLEPLMVSKQPCCGRRCDVMGCDVRCFFFYVCLPACLPAAAEQQSSRDVFSVRVGAFVEFWMYT